MLSLVEAMEPWEEKIMNAATKIVDTDRIGCEDAACALRGLLAEGCSADAYQLDGTWYVVTRGTGEGTFAYDAQSVAELDLEAGWVQCEEGQQAEMYRVCTLMTKWTRDEAFLAAHAVEDGDEVDIEPVRWDYSTWCADSAASIEEDVRVAVDYYLQTQGLLCAGGVCDRILSARDVEILDAAEAVRA
jgi:hypothetical protein